MNDFRRRLSEDRRNLLSDFLLEADWLLHFYSR